MKKIFALGLLFAIACNSSPHSPRTIGPRVPLTPGTFVGTWKIAGDTSDCVTNVIRDDSILIASVANLKTGEVLKVHGEYRIPIDYNPEGNYYYLASDSSTIFGDTDRVDSSFGWCYFTADGNNFHYSVHRGDSILFVDGRRE